MSNSGNLFTIKELMSCSEGELEGIKECLYPMACDTLGKKLGKPEQEEFFDAEEGADRLKELVSEFRQTFPEETKEFEDDWGDEDELSEKLPRPEPAVEPKKPDFLPIMASKRVTSRSLVDRTIRPGPEKPPRGRHAKIVDFINENMGERTFEELEEFLEGDKGKPSSHIAWAVNRNILEVVEDV